MVEKNDKPLARNNDDTEIHTVTQLTIDDVSGEVPESCNEQVATPEEISQENVMINPDESSMESRG